MIIVSHYDQISVHTLLTNIDLDPQIFLNRIAFNSEV